MLNRIGQFAQRFGRKQQVERWTEAAPEDVPMWIYDGVKMSQVNGRNHPGLYTQGGYSSTAIPHTPKGKIRDDVTGRAIAYLASEYAYNCIRLVTTDISGLPLKVRDKQSKKEVVDHTFITALHNARLYYQQDIILLWQIQRYVFGEIFALPEWNEYGVMNCLRLLNPLAIQKYIPVDRLEGIYYQPNGGHWTFNVNEFAFDKVSSPFDDINGLAPMSLALDAINIDKELKRYTLDTLMKDMRMSGILTARQGSGVNSVDVKKVADEIKKQKDSRLIGLPWQLEYKQVQQAIDSSQLALSDEARRRIAAALGIPMSVAGAWDSATYQSAPAQIEQYYRGVIFPETKRHALFLTEFVLPFFDQACTVEVFYDTTEVDNLLEDKKVKAELAKSDLNAGTITVNQYREARGLKTTPDGNVYYLPTGITIVAAGQLAGGLTAGGANPPLPPVPTLPALPAPPPVSKDVSMKSAYIMLATPNHPDMIALQNGVKEYAKDIECQWNDPASFHVTIVSMPAIADEQISQLIKALDNVDIPDMSLNVGSLNTFDTGTNYAIHFKIRKNDGLMELQSDLVDLCESIGIPLASHSDPANYKPHMTMGYSTARPPAHTFNSKINVKPTALHLGVGGNIVYRKAIGAPPPKPPARVGKAITDDALDELAAWQKKVKNGGVEKALTFKTYLLRDVIGSQVRDGLALADTPEAIKAVFETARNQAATKAIQATRIDFEDTFQDILTDAIAGKITRRQWSARVRTALQTYIYKAFVDGLVDAGVDDLPNSDEQSWINQFISDQSVFVTDLGNTLFKSDTEISSEMAAQKPSLWYNGSIAPAYSEGLLSGDANGMYTWTLGRTEEHCDTCARLDGQTKRYKTWDSLNLIAGTVGQETDCQGWKCDCKLVRRASKSSDVDLLALLAEHTHEHVA